MLFVWLSTITVLTINDQRPKGVMCASKRVLHPEQVLAVHPQPETEMHQVLHFTWYQKT